jgi:SAM-dependent methyltransferase
VGLLKAALRASLHRLGSGGTIFDAAEAGDARQIATLVRQGANVNSHRSDGVTALILAAIGNHVEAIDALLESGADPNLPTTEGWYAYHFAKNSGHQAAADRLLQAHRGVEPQFDYAAAFLNKADANQMAVYKTLFSPEALAQKRFFNIGSGNWRHPYWTNVDYASGYYDYDAKLIDVPWDISLEQPLSTESDSIELGYCCHTTEHLTDKQNRFMFREVHRVLKPGGVFRVTCPNIELYYQAYKRRDRFVYQHYGVIEPLESANGLSRWFVNEIASQLVQRLGDIPPRLETDQRAIDEPLETLSLEAACDHFTSMVDYEIQRKFPGNHINWWTNEKMCRELKAAGFSETIVSIPGACISAAMRDRTFFDIVQPTFSLYVDAVK